VPSNYGYDAPAIRISAPLPVVRSEYSAPAVVRSDYAVPLVKESYGSYASAPLVKSVHIPIVKHLMTTDNAGAFNVDVQTGDGTSQSETGSLKNLGGSEGPVQVKSGSYSYTTPEGQHITTTWTADENVS
jgi:hypothetical protein